MSGATLGHPLLASCGVAHGFGTRAAREPAGLVRPRQVHGARVAVLRSAPEAPLGDADAVVSDVPGLAVGVVTADCVPILLATPGGAVAAVHAGWRGLAAGVIPAAVRAFGAVARDGEAAVAVVGPCIGPGCYEVDTPVVDTLSRRLAGPLEAALRPSLRGRAGHWQLDLARLARAELVAAGIEAERVGGLADACTACDAERFHSYRRDGPRSGRLVHFATAPARESNDP